MLRARQRIGIAAGCAILSLPAFVGAFAGTFFVYVFAMLGGYRGRPLEAVLTLLSSWQGLLAIIPFVLIFTHISVFVYLLVRFAHGLAIPKLAEFYCLAIVMLAIGERIRLQIVDGDVFFWFGLVSVPHVFCLIFIVWSNSNTVRADRFGDRSVRRA